MINILRKGLLSVALLAAIVVNASEKLNVKVKSATSKMLAIELTKVVEGETLTIRDIEGEKLFVEKLTKAEEYSKVFSVSTLPQGLYFVESKSASKIQVTPVIVKEFSVALVKDAAKTYEAPEFTKEGSIVTIKVRNYSKVPVTISVYDDYGTLLTITENNTNTLVFGSYDASGISADLLTVSVTEGEYNFTEDVRL